MVGLSMVLGGFRYGGRFGMDDFGRLGMEGRKWGMLRYPMQYRENIKVSLTKGGAAAHRT